jgi:hypothetical protein
VAREGAGSHQTSSLPDHWLLIVGPVPLDGARVVTIGDELGPDVARVRRLAHPLPSPLRYAARNFSMEKTVPRNSM